MKRICIIGDSHAAALKTGWSTIAADYPDMDLTFFAARSEHMETLEVAGKKLIATTDLARKKLKFTSGGRSAIGNAYDAYAICGLGLKYQTAVQLYKIQRAENNGAESLTAYCKDIFPEAIEDALRSTAAIRILRLLRQITDTAILLIPQPFYAEDGDAPSGSLLGVSDDKRLLLSGLQSACERLVREGKASFLPQPAETRAVNRPATKSEYAVEPSRLDINKTGVGRSHMNSAYGAIVLREALGILANGPVRNTIR